MAYTYNPREVVASWSGVELKGFAKDSFITIERTSDLVVPGDTGGDGNPEISLSPDKTGTLSMDFQQGSNTSRQLGAAVAASDAGNPIVGDITIIDPSGSIFAQCKGALLMKSATITQGTELNSRVWEWWCEEIIMTGTPAGLDEDVATFASFAGSLIA